MRGPEARPVREPASPLEKPLRQGYLPRHVMLMGPCGLCLSFFWGWTPGGTGGPSCAWGKPNGMASFSSEGDTPPREVKPHDDRP